MSMGKTPVPAVRIVVALLIANFFLSLVVTTLILTFRHDVVAYQLARHPGGDAALYTSALWTKPISVVVVAAVYILVARRLLRGDPRGYRRVRMVAILGFVSVLWLLMNAEYPSWLLVMVGVQLILRATLIAAVFRPDLRTVFGSQPEPSRL
jgi:hypothetical protein